MRRSHTDTNTLTICRVTWRNLNSSNDLKSQQQHAFMVPPSPGNREMRSCARDRNRRRRRERVGRIDYYHAILLYVYTQPLYPCIHIIQNCHSELSLALGRREREGMVAPASHSHYAGKPVVLCARMHKHAYRGGNNTTHGPRWYDAYVRQTLNIPLHSIQTYTNTKRTYWMNARTKNLVYQVCEYEAGGYARK